MSQPGGMERNDEMSLWNPLDAAIDERMREDSDWDLIYSYLESVGISPERFEEIYNAHIDGLVADFLKSEASDDSESEES